MAIDNEELNDLIAQRQHIKESQETLTDCLKKTAEKYGVKVTALRRYVTAKTQEDGTEILQSHVDHLQNLLSAAVQVTDDWIEKYGDGNSEQAQTGAAPTQARTRRRRESIPDAGASASVQ